MKNDADTLLAAGDIITISDGVGSKTFGNALTAGTTTVDLLVAAINGDTTISGLTIEADRNGFNEQIVTVAYTSSDGIAETTSSTNGKLYFTYGTDPETGAALNIQTANMAAVNSGGLAAAMATALNAATSAFTATSSLDGQIRIAAQVSGTNNRDYSPLSHAFQTLTVFTTSVSSTKLLAGDNATVVLTASAASNITAVASGFFNFGTSSIAHSGVRVTVRNNSTAVSKNITIIAGASSAAFVGNDDIKTFTDTQFKTLTKGDLITSVANAAGNASTTLTYVALFADIEAPVTTASTAGTTVRVSWLGV